MNSINYKNQLCFYVQKKLTERKLKKPIPFIVSSKNKKQNLKKHLRMNLTKEVKDLYTENYKTSRKEIEKDTNNWKDILWSWTGEITIINSPYCHL